MIEFILILVLANGPAYNGISTIDGFKSLKACEEAAQVIVDNIELAVAAKCVEVKK